MIKREKKIEEILGHLDSEERRDFFRHLRNANFFHEVFDNISEGIIIFDRSLRIQFANFAAYEIFGLPDDFEKQKISSYLKDLDWKSFLASANDKNSATISRREIEINYPMRKILLFHIIPQGRDKASFVGIFHDVTEMYDRRREENEKQKNDMVSLLAAGVAHEIGNPLNVISIHLQLLEKRLAKRKNSAKEDLSLLDVTKKEIARLDNIIKRFFQALRIDKPSFARTNIKTLLIESLNFMKPEVENKRIKINCELPDAIPALRVDEDQIKQAFFNIIKNAIEAMPEGGELDIVCDLGEDFVKISFHDSGQGIEPELMNKIFNPYFTTKKTGSGLGLVVVERIVRENNGKLRLDSSPEHGTTFIIELPLFDKQIKLLAGAETKKNESNPKT